MAAEAQFEIEVMVAATVAKTETIELEFPQQAARGAADSR